MISYRPEVATKLKTAADSLERIGQLLPERAQSACSECAAILHEAAREYAPAESKYPNNARRSAQRLAERMKPAAAAKPTGVGSE